MTARPSFAATAAGFFVLWATAGIGGAGEYRVAVPAHPEPTNYEECAACPGDTIPECQGKVKYQYAADASAGFDRYDCDGNLLGYDATCSSSTGTDWNSQCAITDIVNCYETCPNTLQTAEAQSVANVAQCFVGIEGGAATMVGECGEPLPQEPGCDGHVCTYRGEPVDVFRKTMYVDQVDFEDPAARDLLDLSVRRTYRTDGTPAGQTTAFGHRWFSPIEAYLEILPNMVKFRDGGGQMWPFLLRSGAYSAVHGRGKTLTATASGYSLDDASSGRVLSFDTAGRLVEIVAAGGLQQLTIDRDGSGTPYRAVDSLGRELTFVAAGGRITQAAFEGQTVATYSYTNGELTQVAYPGGGSKTYTYVNLSGSQTVLSRIDDEAGRVEASWDYSAFTQGSLHKHAVTVARGPGSKEALTFGNGGVGGEWAAIVTNAFGEATNYFEHHGRIRKMSGALCEDCPDVATITYDLLGRVETRTDRAGVRTEYLAYDSRGNPAEVVEAAGTAQERVTQYTYHPETSAPLTRVTASVVEATSARETIWDFDSDYDTDPNEAPTLLVHRKIERGLTRTIAGTAVSFEYVTQYGYDAFGRLTSIDGPRTDVSDVTSFTYDATTGALATITDANGLTTTFSNFDAAGRPRSIVDANGNETTLAYDARGRLESRTDVATSAVTSYQYDAAGKLTKIVFPLLNSLTFMRAANGEIETVTDSLGNSLSYAYDAMNHRSLLQVHDPGQNLRRQLAWSHQKSGDAAWPERLRRITNPDSSYTELGYDARGEIASLVDPDGRTTGFDRDALNRPWHVTQYGGAAGNLVTVLQHDANDTLAAVTDPAGHTTEYQTDDLGRVTMVTSPDTGVTRYAYDPAGNVVAKVDAAGFAVGYAYDAGNRLLTVTAPDQTIGYTYDQTDVANGKGRLTQVVDASGTTRYGYDSLGRVTSERFTIDGATYQTTYLYDPNGNLETLVLPSGNKILYEYDAADQVSRVSFQVGSSPAQVLADQVTWMPFGPVAGWMYGNGLVASRSYDLGYRLTALTDGAVDRTYHPSFAGQVSQIDLAIAEPAPAPQLAAEYAYEPGTNRLTSVTRTGEAPMAIGYDARGNVTEYGNRVLAYDSLGRVTSVSRYGITLGSFSYNFRHQRVKKTVLGGTSTLYHHDLAGNLLEETDLATGASRSHVYLGHALGSPPLAMVADGEVFHEHVDHLGTPLRLTDGLQRVVWEAGYSAFGEAAVNEDPDGDSVTIHQPIRLPGQYFDAETDLYYNWHRYYAPELGRYLGPDPIGLRGGLSLYGYVLNDPINAIDPMGLFTSYCHRPLHGLPVEIDPIYHDFLCVTVPGTGKVVCDSTGPGPGSSGLIPGPGAPVPDSPNDTCRAVSDDKCFDNCVLSNLASPDRPTYSASGIGGTNCQEYAVDIVSECRRKCGL